MEAEFAVVEADAAAGAECMTAMIRQFERMEMPADVIEEHRQMQPAAIHPFITDEPDAGEAYLSFTVLPGYGHLIGYSSAQHEEAAGALLARCCRALGYEQHLV